MKAFKRGNKFILLTMIYMIVAPIFIGIFEALFFSKDFSGAWYDIALQLIVIGVPVLYFFKKKRNNKILKGKLKIKEIFLLILLSVCIKPLITVISLISQLFVNNHISEEIASLNNENLIMYLIAVALMPALFEELVSRGIIINYYAKQSVKATILISGLFFGMFHYNIHQFIYAFLLGVLMCYIVLITESIFSSMIMHFFINALSELWPNILKFTLKSVGKIDFKYQAIIMETVHTNDINNSHILVLIIFSMFYVLILTPIAIYIFKLIVKGRNKSLKGSLVLKTYELANIEWAKEEELEEANEKIDNKEISTKEISNVKKDKIFDGYLIAASIIFIIIALIMG